METIRNQLKIYSTLITEKEINWQLVNVSKVDLDYTVVTDKIPSFKGFDGSRLPCARNSCTVVNLSNNNCPFRRIILLCDS